MISSGLPRRKVERAEGDGARGREFLKSGEIFGAVRGIGVFSRREEFKHRGTEDTERERGALQV
jgi:hypothetical protein